MARSLRCGRNLVTKCLQCYKTMMDPNSLMGGNFLLNTVEKHVLSQMFCLKCFYNELFMKPLKL